MTAPITPDERAALRGRADGLRVLARNGLATPSEQVYATDVPRLLDALDTAEAEVARLREALAETTALMGTSNDALVGRLRAARRERDEARAEAERLRADVAILRPALIQMEEAFEEESDAHDTLRAAVSPAWDEETAALFRECDLADADMRKWVRIPVRYLRPILERAERAEAEVEALQRQHNAAFENVAASAREAARAAKAWEEQAHRALDQRDQARAEVARLSVGRAWVCARCGLAPEAHASTESTCVYVPTLAKPVDYEDSLTTQVRAARPAPVWDEEVVVAAVARAIAIAGDYDGCFERLDAWADASDEARECGDVEEPLSTDAEDAEFWHSRARAAVAVVREHLPVRPDRETVVRAMHAEVCCPCDPTGCDVAEVSENRYADAVLDLWPGESRATVQAQALHDAADWLARMDDGRDAGYNHAGRDIIAHLRDRADRLKKGVDHD